MTITEGGIDYGINVDGNYDKRFDGFIKKATNLNTTIKKLAGVTQRAMKLQRQLEKSSGTGDSKKKLDNESALLDAQEEQVAVKKEILKLEKLLTSTKSDNLISIKAQLDVLKSVEKSLISQKITTTDLLKDTKAKAQAETKLSRIELNRLTARKLIVQAYKNGAKSLAEVQKATKLSTQEIVEQSKRLRDQETARKQQITTAKEESRIEREKGQLRQRFWEQYSKQRKRDDVAFLNNAKEEARIARENGQLRQRFWDAYNKQQAEGAKNLSTEEKATARISKQEEKRAIVRKAITQAYKQGARQIEDVQRITGLSAKSLTQESGYLRRQVETRKKIVEEAKKAAAATAQAGKGANKLFLSFTQVLATVARFQLARRLYSFIVDSVDEMIRFNAEMEASTTGMASLIASVAEVRTSSGKMASDVLAFNTALDVSGKLMRQLRIDAATTEATYEGLVQAMQVGIAPALDAGLNLEQTRQTIVNITRAAQQLGVPVRQFGEEIRSVLQGTIKLSTTRLAPLFTNEDIKNAREQGRLFEYMSEELGVFAESADYVADTYKVLKSNVQDASSAVLASGGQEYFENLKDLLRTVRSLLVTTGEDGVQIINPKAQKIADNFGGAMAYIVKQVDDFVSNEDNIEKISNLFEDLTTTIEIASRCWADTFPRNIGRR